MTQENTISPFFGDSDLSNDITRFDQKLETFVAGCNQLLADNYATMPNFPENVKEHLEIKRSKKYIKVCRYNRGECHSVFCFIAPNGDVLKPASWSAPAKHARGNIFDAHNGLKHMSWTGCA